MTRKQLIGWCLATAALVLVAAGLSTIRVTIDPPDNVEAARP